jgi:hypothetical protein
LSQSASSGYGIKETIFDSEAGIRATYINLFTMHASVTCTKTNKGTGTMHLTSLK